MTAITLREQLNDLLAERALAGLVGLHENEAYMADLEDEIDEVDTAYVIAAVTEIASLRGEIDGLNQG